MHDSTQARPEPRSYPNDRRGTPADPDMYCFFFSSRRRHTRCLSDWSSDECSSDLALIAHLNEIMRRHPSAYWVELLTKVGVPCGPINTIDETFADPQVQHLGIAKPISHPKLGPQKRSEERRVGKESR